MLFNMHDLNIEDELIKDSTRRLLTSVKAIPVKTTLQDNGRLSDNYDVKDTMEKIIEKYRVPHKAHKPLRAKAVKNILGYLEERIYNERL